LLQGRRILVVGTTSNRGVLQQLNVLDFERELAVPAVTNHEQLANLLWQSGQFTDQNDINYAMQALQHATGTDRVDLGVKKVLSTLEGAVTASDGSGGNSVAELFVDRLSELIISQ
jgi:vesicle-fusing ATPase